jgi:hypothetical protein
VSAVFNARVLALAVTEFNVLQQLGDPITPAAFGIAVAHLQSRLNLSLLVAAEMLRIELDRIATLPPHPATVKSEAEALREREAILRMLNDPDKT